MDDFAKFQPHQIADDTTVITFGPLFCVCFMSFSGPFLIMLLYFPADSDFFIRICFVLLSCDQTTICIWTASSEFGTYRLCEQRRFRRACASAQSRSNKQ